MSRNELKPASEQIEAAKKIYDLCHPIESIAIESISHFLATRDARIIAEARARRAEEEKNEVAGFLASIMDAVNQELRENGPADVGQYYRWNDARNGVRYLVDLLSRKRRDAESQVAALTERVGVLELALRNLEITGGCFCTKQKISADLHAAYCVNATKALANSSPVAAEAKREHEKAFEYDGAFKCFVCGGVWGAISGPKVDPNYCAGPPAPQGQEKKP